MAGKSIKQTDGDLILQLRKGQEPAFKELFYRYEDRVYFYALKLTSSKEASEELMHDIFIKVWEYREKIDETKDFSSLLFRIAKNHIINYLRDQSKQLRTIQQPAPLTEESSECSAENRLIWKEHLQVMGSAIQELSRQRRSIFTLSRHDGLSYEEIAHALGISKNTVRIQMIKSLKFIREYMTVHSDLLLAVTLSLFYFS